MYRVANNVPYNGLLFNNVNVHNILQKNSVSCNKLSKNVNNMGGYMYV